MQAALKEEISKGSEMLKDVLGDVYNRFCVVDNKCSPEAKRQHAQVVLQIIKVSLRSCISVLFSYKNKTYVPAAVRPVIFDFIIYL